MAELRDVDIDMISIVKKGANRKVFAILKSADGGEDTMTGSIKEKIRAIFKGEDGQPTTVEKGMKGKVECSCEGKGTCDYCKNEAKGKPIAKTDINAVIPTFEDRFALNAWDNHGWTLLYTLSSTIYAILSYDKPLDKPSAVRAACASFADVVVKKTLLEKGEDGRSAEDIQQFVASFAVESIEKGAEAVSVTLKKYDPAPEAPTSPQEEEPMSKELNDKLDAILKGVGELANRVTVIEKAATEEPSGGEPTPAGTAAPVVVEKTAAEKEMDGKLDAILKSVGALGERVGKIEKVSGVPASDGGDGGPIEKSDNASGWTNSPFFN